MLRTRSDTGSSSQKRETEPEGRKRTLPFEDVGAFKCNMYCMSNFRRRMKTISTTTDIVSFESASREQKKLELSRFNMKETAS